MWVSSLGFKNFPKALAFRVQGEGSGMLTALGGGGGAVFGVEEIEFFSLGIKL